MKVLITSGNSYRTFEPYSNLKIDGIEFLFISPEMNQDEKYDAIVLHQPIDKTLIPFIQQFQSDGGVLVVDTDDDLFNLPFSNPVYEELKQKNGLPVFKECLRLADYIHVSTPQLKKALPYPTKTEVFLNSINFDNYRLDEKERIRDEFRREHKIPEGNKIIGWQGTPSHVDSLALIRPAMKELLQRGNITFAIASNIDFLNILGLTGQKNIVCIGWQDRNIALEFPAACDVFLCPLPDNKFNNSKSEIKVLESSVWEVPTVCSMVSPFIRFNEKSHGGNYLVHKERIKHWINTIDLALKSPASAENAYLCVKNDYDLKVLNENRKKWWSALLKK